MPHPEPPSPAARWVDVFRGRRLLVTGSTCQLATHLIASLSGVRCTILRFSRPGTRFPVVDGACRIETATGGLEDRALWKELLEGVDFVFHFAAHTSYGGDKDAEADLKVNFLPMMHLLEVCRENRWRPAILFAGTVTEIGIPDGLPVGEDHPARPITIYDLHKLTAETYLDYYARQGHVRGVTLRLANVYGPGTTRSNSGRGVLNITIDRALRGESPTIYGAGAHLRDFLYISDAVDAFLAAAAAIERVDGRFFVVGTGEGHTIADAIRMIAARVEHAIGRCPPVREIDHPEPPLPILSRDFVADPRSLIEATGWRPTVRLREGIDRTIEYFRSSER